MKSAQVLILFSIPLFFIACNNKDKQEDIILDIEYDATLPVDVPLEKSTRGIFSTSTLIEPSSDEDVAIYLDYINNWEITYIRGEITDVSEEFRIVNSTLTVSSGSFSTSWFITGSNIADNSVVDLSNDEGQWDVMLQILQSKDSFSVSYSGETDLEPLSFIFRFKTGVRITATPPA